MRNVSEAREAMRDLSLYRTRRTLPYEKRRKLHEERFGLPLLPTTSIGSLPQTAEVRKARQNWRKGNWDDGRYDHYVKSEIKKWIGIQEEIGLDVLIHGEF